MKSLRPYPRLSDIRRMVVRSAYAELDYSPLKLAFATLGMALTFVFGGLALLVGITVDDRLRSVMLGLMVWLLLTVIGFFLPTMPVTLNVFFVALSLVLSAAVGLLSGIAPAWRAARLNPIEALRQE